MYWSGPNQDTETLKHCGVAGGPFTAGGDAKWDGAWETFWWPLTKLNILLSHVSAIVLFCMYLKENNTYVQRKTNTRCLLSFIHICRNLETTKMTFHRWISINSVHPANGHWNVTQFGKKTPRLWWKCEVEMPEEHNWQGDVRSVKVAREDWGS